MSNKNKGLLLMVPIQLAEKFPRKEETYLDIVGPCQRIFTSVFSAQADKSWFLLWGWEKVEVSIPQSVFLHFF